MPFFSRTVATAILALAAAFAGLPALAQAKVGVLLLHGKSPGSASDPNSGALRAPIEREGWLFAMPDMPWSRARFLDGHWDGAMEEITGHVKALRGQGATKIVLIGHSMGVPAAMSYTARGGEVQGIVMLAPGHVPSVFYTRPPFKAVRDSVDEARTLVAAGKGASRERFSDFNQGRQQTVIATAVNYLSYYDPGSDAEMSVTAPRIPAGVPSFTVVGDKDPLFSFVKSYYVEKLPAHPKTRYMEVSAGHLDTPRVAEQEVVRWIKDVTAD